MGVSHCRKASRRQSSQDFSLPSPVKLEKHSIIQHDGKETEAPAVVENKSRGNNEKDNETEQAGTMVNG